jgi:hypothetical protein
VNPVKTIWILGSKNPNADRSIPRETKKFPDFSDPDILIIDLTTLDQETLTRIDKFQYDVARRTIVDRFLNGGMIIFITSPKYTTKQWNNDTTEYYTNYYLSPFNIETEKVPQGSVINTQRK